MPERVLLAISACLTGQKVRYDGRDKENAGLKAWLGAGVAFKPLCPEAQSGLTIPREPMSLVAVSGIARAVGCESGRDYTPVIAPWCERQARMLAESGAWGVLLKSNSPSCAGTHPAPDPIDGLLASALRASAPLLPFAHEKEVADVQGRFDFASRMTLLKKWRDASAGGIDRPGLIKFHTAAKLELMAHSPSGCTALGRVVANPAMKEGGARSEEYERLLLACLASRATEGRVTNALSHAAGYLRGRVSEEKREALLEAVEGYRTGHASLAAALDMLAAFAAEASIPYLMGQTLLNPHPAARALLEL